MKEIITERPNLFEPNVYITMCVELCGRIDPHKLTAAVYEAYYVNEATMSKVVLEKDKAYYDRLPVTGCKVSITDKNLLTLIKEYEKIPFAIDKGELVRTFIILTETNTLIMIMAHHLVGDGKSLIYFIKDMMSALSKTSLTYKPLTLLTKNHLSETRLSVPAKLYTRYCKRKWNNRYFDWQDYYRLHNKYWNTVSSNIRYETLTQTKTKEIIKKAKQIGCSVNSYIVTWFLQKYEKRCEVGIPVSIRKSGNEAMSNLTSGVSIKYKFNTKKTFAENALIVHRKIKKKLMKYRLFVLKFITELPATLIDAVLLNTHDCYFDRLAQKTAKIMEYREKTRDIGVTNLTKIDIPAVYGSYKINNVIFVPPAVSYSRNIIGVSTFDGRMTFSFHNVNYL